MYALVVVQVDDALGGIERDLQLVVPVEVLPLLQRVAQRFCGKEQL